MTHTLEGHPTMPAAVPEVSELGGRRAAWESKLQSRIALTDLVILCAAVAIAMVWKFGTDAEAMTHGPLNLNYQSLGAVIAIVWWTALWAYGSRNPRLLGNGTDEYTRVARASISVIGWLAIASLAFKWDMSRGYLAIAFPLGLVGLLTGRKVWRVALRRARRKGHAISKVLVVGGTTTAKRIALNFTDGSSAGYRVTGVWVPDADIVGTPFLGVPNTFIPVLGQSVDLVEAIRHADADTVVVSDTEHLGATGLRELAWQLEGVDVDLMVSPNLVDVAGPRMHMKALGNEPYIHLEEPQYAAAGSWPKVLFDRTGAALLVLLFSPLLLATAIAVKVTSPGPIFYRQDRIGRDGEVFRITKFRSMRPDADAQLMALLKAQGTTDDPLFKIENDPRITSVGRFIRRFSIDELPQLFDVIRGDMSLVGPRPQRKEEVELYDHVAHRRLRVRPGMTGLWQVSGRSDLSWEDAVRLDNYYVENWSLIGDLVILWKTVRAVLGSDGAY